MYLYMLGTDQLESSFLGKDGKILEDTKLSTGQQCALVAKVSSGTLSCIKKIVTSRSSKIILPLYSALISTWSAVVSSELPRTGNTWPHWSPAKGPKTMNEGPGASFKGREAVRAVTIQPGEEKAQGRSHQWIQVPDGRK